MKMPARIHNWLTPEEMGEWVRQAPNLEAYKKRLAIWLTERGPFHAHRVSDLLQVSKQAVWLWVKQYNHEGPKALNRKGRGGRRRAYLSEEEELKLVAKLQELIASGQARKAKELLPEVLKTVRQQVSVAYVYRLMQRYEKHRGLRALTGAGEKPKTRTRASAAKAQEDAVSLLQAQAG